MGKIRQYVLSKRRIANGERRAASKRCTQEKKKADGKMRARKDKSADSREKKASARTREIEIDDGRGAG